MRRRARGGLQDHQGERVKEEAREEMGWGRIGRNKKDGRKNKEQKKDRQKGRKEGRKERRGRKKERKKSK